MHSLPKKIGGSHLRHRHAEKKREAMIKALVQRLAAKQPNVKAKSIAAGTLIASMLGLAGHTIYLNTPVARRFRRHRVLW